MAMNLKKYFLISFLVIPWSLAGNYTVQLGEGNYQGYSTYLNPPIFWDGAPTGAIILRTPTDGSFILFSRGNSFRVTTRLSIEIPSPDIFWSNNPPPYVSRVTFSMGEVNGTVSLTDQYLLPMMDMDLTKPISADLSSGTRFVGDATEVRLVDEYSLGSASIPGSKFSILTTFESGPVATGGSRIIMTYDGLISNLLAGGAFVASEFYIQDLNGNGANYLSVIPEPSAVSLLAVGLGVVLRRRRRTV
jgi:hypothetical protein